MQPEEKFSLEEMMHSGEIKEDPEVNSEAVQPSRQGAFVAFSLVLSFLVVCAFVAMALSGNAQAAAKEKQTRMESLATSISAGQNWDETRNESPSENSKGWLIREWKTGNFADLDNLAAKLGVTMEAVPYPSGCQEGKTGEFLIQLCAKPDQSTVSLVIA